MNRARVLLQQTPSPHSVTHEVLNQAPLLEGFNAFRSNRRMIECVKAFHSNPKDYSDALSEYGSLVGSAEWQSAAKHCQEYPPVFTPFDKQGRRIENVVFQPQYHNIMNLAIKHRVPSLSWVEPRTEVARGALGIMHYQLEFGTSCPITMTRAAYPVLAGHNSSGLFSEWIEKLKAPVYDGRDVHISKKQGVTCGMSMTEKQGGSDVRQNTTRATPVSGSSNTFHLMGHKWFTSAPMCDAFLTLAYTEKGMTCFLVPRWLSPEERNVGLRFQRLKNKLGDRSNASSEVEYHNAVGWLVGEEGKGIQTIIEMVNYTRLDCSLGGAGLMQLAVFHAVHHVSHRKAFGSILAEKPLMLNVLSDLALEVEGATALALRTAYSFDQPEQATLKRILLAIAKYYICKRVPAVTFEALECMGGNGFVEDFPLAAMYRQAPLNAIWEGSGNVIILDVFRALAKDPGCLDALLEEVKSTGVPSISSAFSATMKRLKEAMKSGSAELLGRQFVEELAVILEACALVKSNGPQSVTDAFIASRIAGQGARLSMFGTLPKEACLKELIERHSPVF